MHEDQAPKCNYNLHSDISYEGSSSIIYFCTFESVKLGVTIFTVRLKLPYIESLPPVSPDFHVEKLGEPL